MQGSGNGLKQFEWRFRANVGGEGAIVGGGAEYLKPTYTRFRAVPGGVMNHRVVVNKQVGSNSHAITLFVQKNGGTWYQVTTISPGVKMVNSPSRYPAGSPTTNHADRLRLSASWGGDPDNGAATGGNISASNFFALGSFLEHEWTYQFDEGLAVGDIFTFRCRSGVAVFQYGYTSIIRITIAESLSAELTAGATFDGALSLGMAVACELTAEAEFDGVLSQNMCESANLIGSSSIVAIGQEAVAGRAVLVGSSSLDAQLRSTRIAILEGNIEVSQVLGGKVTAGPVLDGNIEAGPVFGGGAETDSVLNGNIVAGPVLDGNITVRGVA